MWKLRHVLRNPEGEGGAGGAGAAAPAPAAPAPAPAAPAPGPAAPSPAPAAPAASPAPAAPSPSPAPAADTKGTWPADWRETVSKDDAKKLAQLQRYGSPQVALEALFAAQERIRSGELKPVLGKNPSAEELKEWREAHGIPEDPAKYDLKDVKIDEGDKPALAEVFKAMHAANATPEVVKAAAKAWNAIKVQAMAQEAERDKATQQTTEDALRSEWGGEFRRNMNLIHGLLDGSGSQTLKDSLMGGRLADGTPIGSSPEALRMLLGLALVQNPTGVVVPGGSAATGEGIREELEKLQKVPTAKKSDAQSQRQRDLIAAAIKAGVMDDNGAWKK